MKAVFLDRDGTIIEDKNYLRTPEEVVFLPGAIEALVELARAGYQLVMVTNQSGVGRGYYTLAEVRNVHSHIGSELGKLGISFLAEYVAPEAPDQPSRGRKPSPQFLFDARDQFGIDLAQSYMVGDKLIDLQCGWNAGVKRSILVRTGYGANVERQDPSLLKDAVIVDDFKAAAGWILADLP